MNQISNFVSLHPYFKVHPGKLDAFKAGLPAFVEKTKTEEKNLFFDFTINGDEVLCREGYTDAEGLLAHLANVDAPLKGGAQDRRPDPAGSARSGRGARQVEGAIGRTQTDVVRSRSRD